MYPLLTNERSLTPRQVLEAHKRQPCIEKRFEQLKTVLEVAPVFLKNEGRIEALFTLYFLALLVQALIERDEAARAELAAVLPVLECLHETYLALRRHRETRGALDFEAPEVRVAAGRERHTRFAAAPSLRSS